MKRAVVLLVGLLVLAPSAASANAVGPVLPNAQTTPGATNPLVTQSTIDKTICVLGFTKTIRPPVSYTTGLKKSQLRTLPYSGYGSTDTKLFEEDHLIPLELGGHPTNPKNLWPEPWSAPYGARLKDSLENKLHLLVCSHQITLRVAQKAIATDWYLAYKRYVQG